MEAKESVVGRPNPNLPSKRGDNPEVKWAARLFIIMMACMVAVCVIHAIGEVMIIAHIYA